MVDIFSTTKHKKTECKGASFDVKEAPAPTP